MKYIIYFFNNLWVYIINRTWNLGFDPARNFFYYFNISADLSLFDEAVQSFVRKFLTESKTEKIWVWFKQMVLHKKF